MKTEKQIARDKANGILNLERSFDKKSGKILTKGLIRQEMEPEKLAEIITPAKEKIKELAENLKAMKKALESAPVSCPAEVLEFVETQKKAAKWAQAESLRVQVAQRQEDYDTLVDDITEQEVLLQEYKDWKK